MGKLTLRCSRSRSGYGRGTLCWSSWDVPFGGVESGVAVVDALCRLADARDPAFGEGFPVLVEEFVVRGCSDGCGCGCWCGSWLRRRRRRRRRRSECGCDCEFVFAKVEFVVVVEWHSRSLYTYTYTHLPTRRERARERAGRATSASTSHRPLGLDYYTLATHFGAYAAHFKERLQTPERVSPLPSSGDLLRPHRLTPASTADTVD